jgi:hypothetical protein
MGLIYSCDFCQEKQTVDNPIMVIKSYDKYRGKNICFNCIEQKILEKNNLKLK